MPTSPSEPIYRQLKPIVDSFLKDIVGSNPTYVKSDGYVYKNHKNRKVLHFLAEPAKIELIFIFDPKYSKMTIEKEKQKIAFDLMSFDEAKRIDPREDRLAYKCAFEITDYDKAQKLKAVLQIFVPLLPRFV